MRQFVPELEPRIGERTERNCETARSEIGFVIDRGPACRTEMEPNLPACLAAANKDLVVSFDPDLGLVESSRDTKQRR